MKLLDCTFRDGGYHNSWDFSPDLISAYLEAIRSVQVDLVEQGFRFLKNEGFKGPCAYTTDEFLRTLNIPEGVTVGVMVNGSDLLTEFGLEEALESLFPESADRSPVDLVRLACHFHEFERVLPAAAWLAQRGYRVGLNLMQIADRSREEVVNLAYEANLWPVEVLYFADSMGSMRPDDTSKIIGWLREEWDGELGIHTHDNMGLALENTLRAYRDGVTWLDATVTGMGRGPGNARTEELVIEAESLGRRGAKLVPLLALIREYFEPLKARYGWGTNTYYYLSGKYGIHPTYIQEMLGDARYDDEDVVAVIDHLREEGGKKFSFDALDGARQFYRGDPRGTWAPASLMTDRDVLMLGTGPGVAAHRPALEAYIRRARPLVVALNTQEAIDSALIDLRIGCHPVRLLADAETHTELPQPLITPVSMLPETLRAQLADKEVLDFGLAVEADTFAFYRTHCVAPSSMVVAYALAVITSGQAKKLYLAGFDGYGAEDPRNREMDHLLATYLDNDEALPCISLTPTSYHVESRSVYAL